MSLGIITVACMMGQLILQAGGEQGLGTTGVSIVRAMIGAIIMATLARFVAYFVSELCGAARPKKDATGGAGAQLQECSDTFGMANPMQAGHPQDEHASSFKHVEPAPAGDQQAAGGHMNGAPEGGNDVERLKLRARTIYSEHDRRHHPQATQSTVPQDAPTANAELGDALPSEWVSRLDANSGKTYFYNSSTGVSSWEQPAHVSAVQAKTQQL